MKNRHSDYMNWAKLHSKARYNLATSGVGAFPLRELGVTIDQLEINGDSTYGYAPLQEAIAKKCEVSPDSVVAAAGTSMANHLAMAALLEPGDEVLMEHPTYELLVSTARYFGADVKSFARLESERYALNPATVRKAVSAKTKLIVITNLHNPSSVLAPDATLREVGDIASSIGAHVLVDEVYLDAVYENTPRTSFHLGPEFIVTNSLTKVYGLSGLRCGWIFAEPELAERMWRLNDLFGVNQPHQSEMLSCFALDRLDEIAAGNSQRLATNRAIFNDFVNSRSDVDCMAARHGITVFPRWLGGDSDRLHDLLRTKYDTSVVPGRWFELPDRFRIGLGGDTAMLQEGLARICEAMDQLK